jgi:hypothetical protein
MSRIAVVWAGLSDDDDEAQTWYENRHVPATIAKLESSARNAEQIVDNPFQEVTQVNGKHMTIYDLPENQTVQDFEEKIRPTLGDIPEGARLDTRCYSQYFRFDGEEWRDGTLSSQLVHTRICNGSLYPTTDPRDVRMWAVVLWEPIPEVAEEFMTWFIDDFTPGMLDSPELLRTRMFTLEHATNVRGQKCEEADKSSLLKYMTIWEFENEDFPWEILVYLGSSEKWRDYMEGGKVVRCRSRTRNIQKC